MTELAAISAILISLVALWLGSQAQNQVHNTFKDFTERLMNQVREAKSEFDKTSTRVENEIRDVSRTASTLEHLVKSAETQIRTLSEQLKKTDATLQALIEAIPPNMRRKAIAKTSTEPDDNPDD